MSRLANHRSLFRMACGFAVWVALFFYPGSLVKTAEPTSIGRQGPTPAAVTFEADIQPLLTRLGCNAGACHGKARGQNGFALSLLGFDADFDYDAITQEARGRRLLPAAPESSLFLRKPTGQVSHGGGKRLDPRDPGYDVLRRWIAAG